MLIKDGQKEKKKLRKEKFEVAKSPKTDDEVIQPIRSIKCYIYI